MSMAGTAMTAPTTSTGAEPDPALTVATPRSRPANSAPSTGPSRSALGAPPGLFAPPGPAARWKVPVSATLAANEVLTLRRQTGQPVLPMAFGEAGLPAHPLLQAALAAGATTAGGNAYGPVAGQSALREAAAGYWTRRGLPTSAGDVVAGPGSKPLLFGLLLAMGTDVAMPRPSWVSYAAQTAMIGSTAHFVPVPPGEGGVCDPARLAHTVVKARAAGRRIGAVIVTLPDNPTGQLARPATVRALAEVAAEYDLIIISDEIYRDLRYDTAPRFISPATFAPERTVVTTALSKSLALGGWRIGVARLPAGAAGAALRDRLIGIGSEIWSATAGPVQEAAALAFSEPPELASRIALSQSLHAAVSRAVAARFRAAGIDVPAPQAAFYLYPDFAPWREHLAGRYGVDTSAELAALLLERYGMGVLPASAFGEDARSLRLRVATGMLYGETDAARERALASGDPVSLPWIASALDRVEEIMADLAA